MAYFALVFKMFPKTNVIKSVNSTQKGKKKTLQYTQIFNDAFTESSSDVCKLMGYECENSHNHKNK